MPIIRESEGRDLVHSSRSSQCGTKTVGVPQYALTVTNEEQPQPEPPTPPIPPIIIPLPGKAISPSPANDSSTGNYPFGLTFSWGNGGGATSYVVWLNGVFQAVQVGTSFVPPLLSTSTTYSWRIDSLNDGGITIGDTWTFTTAGQVYPPTPPLPAVNPSPANGDISVDPTSVTLSWSDGGDALSYDVYINGVFQGNQPGTSFLVGALTALTGYTWRIDSVNAVGTTVGATWSFTTNSGIPPAPSKAINPVPANTAANVNPQSTMLGWDNGGGATSYDVYVNGVFQVNQPGTVFDPGILNSFDSYTWRIDSVNAGGTTTGDTWTFDTTGHATVIAWAAQVITNGGAAVSNATKQALSTFCFGLDDQGLTALLTVINCIVPDNLIAAQTPLVNGGFGNNPWTNINFVDGDLSVDGLVGNGSNKRLATGIFPSDVFSLTSASAVIYNTLAGSANCQIAGATNSNGKFRLGWTAGNYFEAFADATFITGSNTTAWWEGYVCGSKTDALVRNVYAANSGNAHASIANNSSADGGGTTLPNNRDISVFSGNEDGAPGNFAAMRLSFVAFGSGVSSGQSAALFTLVQAMRTALGGGYV